MIWIFFPLQLVFSTDNIDNVGLASVVTEFSVKQDLGIINIVFHCAYQEMELVRRWEDVHLEGAHFLALNKNNNIVQSKDWSYMSSVARIYKLYCKQ